jgi:hypothetical protein
VNLRVNFLKVGLTHPRVIEARVVAQTRRIITVRAEFRRDDSALIADATAQQILSGLRTLARGASGHRSDGLGVIPPMRGLALRCGSDPGLAQAVCTHP